MTAVFIFFVGMAAIFLLGFLALPFVILFSVKLFKGQIKIPMAVLTASILFVTGLFPSAIFFLANIKSELAQGFIYIIFFFVGVLAVWKLVAPSFSDKRTGKTIGSLLVYSIISSFVLPIFIAGLSFGLRAVSVQPFYIKGVSMSPALSEGDYILVDVLNKGKGAFERGDIVVYHNQKNGKEVSIHRVVGLPGEKISLNDGRVFVNGEVLDESYLLSSVKTYGLADGPIELSDDEYFVLGDDRGIAKDSRSLGALKKDAIIGEVVFRGYPFDRLGVIGGGR